MSTPSHALGPFELNERVGSGGMGEVWQATHKEQGATVAIKFMTHHKARERIAFLRFRAEVQAVSRLHHANVVYVYDSGLVTKKVGVLLPGTPYLVMELLDGGDLNALVRAQTSHPMLTWPSVRALLIQILRALAHAHARDVVHCDLKASNVLLRSANTNTPQCVLADFGIARTLETPQQWLGGTPAYMAPEQFEPHHRYIGGHTDLYALGVLAYALTSGHLPFATRDTTRLAELHRTAPRPALQPRFAVPEALTSWVHTLMEPQPTKRFKRAADALNALLLLGPEDIISETPTPHTAITPEDATQPYRLASRHRSEHAQLTTAVTYEPSMFTLSESETHAKSPLHLERAPPQPIPWSPDWRVQLGMEANTEPSRTPLWDVGLGLFGLREGPLVGRDTVCNQLWDALATVQHQSCVQTVVLSGKAGLGKSRLLAWVQHSAHEVGAAHTMRAQHDAQGGPHTGLTGMLLSFFRLREAPNTPIDLNPHLSLHGIQNPRLARKLSELLTFKAQRAAAPTPARFATMLELLTLLASDGRSIVIGLDDVQWASDALEFVRYVITAAPQCPVLFTLSVRRDAQDANPHALNVLHELVTQVSSCVDIPLAPLTDLAQGSWIESHLGLCGALADHIKRSTAGNPLLALHMIRHWIQHGALKPGTAGLVLREGAVLPTLTSEHPGRLWLDPLDHMLKDTAPSWRNAIEVGAALGLHIHASEWDAVCRDAGVSPEELVLALCQHGLATQDSNQGWSFIHGMLHESILTRAKTEGRWQQLHRTCARVLSLLQQVTASRLARRGRHHVEAGAFEASLDPFYRAAHLYIRQNDFISSNAVLHEREAVFEQLQPEENPQNPDPRRVENWLDMGFNFSFQSGRLEAARVWTERAQPHVEASRDPSLLLKLHGNLGYVAMDQGHLEHASQHLHQSHLFAQATQDVRYVGWALRNHAAVKYRLGAVHEAIALAEAALEHATQHQAEYATAQAQQILAEVLKGAQPKRSKDLALHALAYYEAFGTTHESATLLNHLGDLARLNGALDEAQAHYEKALEIYTSQNLAMAIFPRINMCLVKLQQGAFDDAQTLLQPLIQTCESQHQTTLLAILHTLLVPCVITTPDETLWQEQWRRAMGLLEATRLVEPDCTLALELAMQRAQADPHWAPRAQTVEEALSAQTASQR